MIHSISIFCVRSFSGPVIFDRRSAVGHPLQVEDLRAEE